MFRYILLILVGLALEAAAAINLERENDFFGVPGLSRLSNQWITEITNPRDTTDQSTFYDWGFVHPVDIEVLKLAQDDYRCVVLDAVRILFTEFRIDLLNGLSLGDVIRSGSAPSECGSATAMCQIKQGDYFDPESDRVAVAFKAGARIGIFQLDAESGTFHLDSAFNVPGISKPSGIFWALGNFFIVDDQTQSIVRTDEQGNVISHYGSFGSFHDRYRWINGISGYVAASDTIHLYVGDGLNGRVDHLVTTQNDTTIYLHSQDYALRDFFGGHSGIHEIALIPGVGIAGLDRSTQQLFFWDSHDSLQNANRESERLRALDYWLNPELATPTFHMQEACGRLVFFTLTDNTQFWAVRSYRLGSTVFDDPSPLPDEHWTIDKSPMEISDTYHIPSGTTLQIDAGVQVLFAQGAGIVIDEDGARLVVNGTPANPVRFEGKDNGTETWTGIKVEPGSSLYMAHARLLHADSFCVFAEHPGGCQYPVNLHHCYFNGSKMNPEEGNFAITIWAAQDQIIIMDDCRIDSMNGRGLDLRGCNVIMNHDTVQNCALSPAYLYDVTGEIVGCRFAGRALDHGLILDGTICNPFFRCCEFVDIAPQDIMVPGYDPVYSTVIALPGVSPVFGWSASDNYITNVFSDSSATLLWMSGDGALPVICGDGVESRDGRNDWYQKHEEGVYISWMENGSEYKAYEQFWNRELQDVDFFPEITDLFVYNPHETQPYGLCGDVPQYVTQPDPRTRGRDATLDSLAGDVALFEQGLTDEAAREYAAAHSMFLQVAQQTTDYTLRWQSMAHVLSTLRHLPNLQDSTIVISLVDSFITASGNLYKVRVHGNRVLTGYYLDRGNYDQAISVCTALFQTELTSFDSLLVAIDLVNAQLLRASSSGRGTLDEASLAGVPAAFRVLSKAQGLRLHAQLLNELGQHYDAKVNVAAIPQTYKLYQNYPNPFNPNTEIKFDLPEAVKVHIKIFNTLGQEVITLVDEVRPAGAHRIMWDSKSASGVQVASGVYVYQIKAGSFVDSKKMVLIR